MCYLTKCLAALTSLVDSSTPSVNNAFMLEVIPHGESGCRHGSLCALLFNVPRGFVCHVPLTKLVELDGDMGPTWPPLW